MSRIRASKIATQMPVEEVKHPSLPAGWRMVRFDEFAESVGDRVEPQDAETDYYVGLEHLDTDSLKIRRWGKPEDVEATKLRVRRGDIIFGKRRAYQRKIAVADSDGICSAHAMVIRARSHVVEPDYVPLFMESDLFMERALAISVGSLSPTINWSALAKERFPLPPREIQRQTAQVLGAFHDYEEALVELRQSAEALRAATIINLYERGIGHTEFKQTALGSRPFTWEVAPLQKHYEVRLGKMMSKAAVRGTDQRPYMRNANVQWNRLDLSTVETMSFSPEEVEKFSLRCGDILACEGRHVGKSAIWRDEIPGACYQKALHRLRALDSNQVPEYMLYHMQYSSWVGLFSESTGETTIPHLPAEKLRLIPFAFPPRQEQTQIAETIESLDKPLQCTQRRLEDTRRLRSAVANRLICGKEGA